MVNHSFTIYRNIGLAGSRKLEGRGVGRENFAMLQFSYSIFIVFFQVT